MTERLTFAVGAAATAAYIATIFLANWAIEEYGIVSVGFGQMAPAAVYFVGLALAFRDLVQRTLGRQVVVWAILIGAALSYVVAPDFALASGVAFLASELLDLAVYTPLAARGWTLAVICSNIAGAALDSLIFLWIAFGSLAFFWGQMLGKTWATLAFVVVALAIRQAVRVRTA